MIEKFEDLLEQSYDAPHGKVKIGILEEAIRIADVHLGPEEQFDARMLLVDTAIFSGHGEKAIVAFAWCLAYYDKHPEMANDHQMMWNYKWVADRLLLFPDIELAKVEATLEDLRKRFIQSGHGPHYYYYLKHVLAMNLEKTEEVKHYYEKWIAEPSDSLSDCHACTLANKTQTLLYLGKLEEALDVAQPILAGKVFCHSVPHRTYADLLLPLLKADRKAEADTYYQKCYELIYNQTGFLDTSIKLFTYLAITDTPKAVSFLEKYFKDAYETDESIVKFDFYIVATTIWDILEEQDSKTIQLPDSVKIEDIKQEMGRLATLFDEQNQTNVYTNKIKRVQTEIQGLQKIFQ
ncbi:hypothetical protein MK805_12540 [Shimazuella sp. AN120528]|uniref:hypothetical protein n=1 Tax=Shimazuella soli TaxID=1892854 RepID=UPI001F0D150F|nr:hypothetical protein [Shimazuella soli]MCH5585771.1 hypothetical protein [Shimazuella soli]